jgi:hypothetical protein
LATFAFLEAAFGLCVGCKIFALGMKLNLVPAEVCAECENIWSRSPGNSTTSSSGSALPPVR